MVQKAFGVLSIRKSRMAVKWETADDNDRAMWGNEFVSAAWQRLCAAAAASLPRLALQLTNLENTPPVTWANMATELRFNKAKL